MICVAYTAPRHYSKRKTCNCVTHVKNINSVSRYEIRVSQISLLKTLCYKISSATNPYHNMYFTIYNRLLSYWKHMLLNDDEKQSLKSWLSTCTYLLLKFQMIFTPGRTMLLTCVQLRACDFFRYLTFVCFYIPIPDHNYNAYIFRYDLISSDSIRWIITSRWNPLSASNVMIKSSNPC